MTATTRKRARKPEPMPASGPLSMTPERFVEAARDAGFRFVRDDIWDDSARTGSILDIAAAFTGSYLDAYGRRIFGQSIHELLGFPIDGRPDDPSPLGALEAGYIGCRRERFAGNPYVAYFDFGARVAELAGLPAVEVDPLEILD